MHRHRDPQAPLERDRQCASRYRQRWNDREHLPDRALARTRADRLRRCRRRIWDRADRRLRPLLRQARSFGPVLRPRHRPGGNVNRPPLDLRLWRRPGHNRRRHPMGGMSLLFLNLRRCRRRLDHRRHRPGGNVSQPPLNLRLWRRPGHNRCRHPMGGMSLLLLNLRHCRRRLDHRRHRPGRNVSRPHSGRRRCRREARHLRLQADNANRQ
jgi:hypothetical protein